MRRLSLKTTSCQPSQKRFFGAKISSGWVPEKKETGESGPRWTETIPNLLNKYAKKEQEGAGAAMPNQSGDGGDALVESGSKDPNDKTLEQIADELGPVHEIGSNGHAAAVMAWEREKNITRLMKHGAGWNQIERPDEADGNVKRADRGSRPGQNSGMYRKWEDEPQLEDLDLSVPQVNCAFIADLLAKRKKEQAAQWGDIDMDRRKANIQEKKEERERERIARGESTLGSKKAEQQQQEGEKKVDENGNNIEGEEGIEGEEPLEDPLDYDEVRNLALHPTDGIMLIDVRTVAEVTSWGTIEGAKIVPMHELWEAMHLSQDEFEDQYGFEMPEKDQTILFFCHHGPRSLMAAQIAAHLGYKNVIHLNGGFYEWSKQYFLLCRRWMVHDYTTGINNRRLLEFESAKHIAKDIAPEFNDIVEAETELIRIDHTRSVGEKELPMPENVKQLSVAFEAERNLIESNSNNSVEQLEAGTVKLDSSSSASLDQDQQQQQENEGEDAEGKSTIKKKKTSADDHAEIRAQAVRSKQGVDPVLSNNASLISEADLDKQEELLRRDYSSEAAKVLRRRKASDRTGIPESFMFRRKEQPHGTGR